MWQRWIGPAVLAAVGIGIGLFVTPAGREAEAQPAKLPDTNLQGLTYKPLPAWVPFESKDTVQKWIDGNDTRSMTVHAWQLWGGLTEWVTEEVGGQKVRVPLYETWFDPSQVFSPPSAALKEEKPGVRPFTRPRQLFHRQLPQARAGGAESLALGAAPPTPTDPLNFRVVTVKYNREMRDHAQANKFYDGSVLQQINNGWGKTPLADRNLKPYPDRAVMLKPVYQFISGTEATLLPYWAGPDKRADQSQPPGPNNWSQKMLVIPPGVQAIPVRGIPTVSLDRFYSIKLSASEVDYLNKNFGPFNPPIQAGDYSILTGMHVSTREIDNWTWQTFWWSLTKPVILDPSKAKVQAPFDNYEVQVGYSFMTGPAKGAAATDGNPNSLPLVCYNPYLEAGFGNNVFDPPFKNQLGIESNCISCHRAAAWPGSTALYVANGLVKPGDPVFFTGNTKSDFVWGQASVPPPPPTKN
jgi:hypothetical protein